MSRSIHHIISKNEVDVKKYVFALLAIAMCITGARAQSQKIGYVNSAKIFQELPAAQEAQRKIDALGKPIQDSLEAMQRELQTRYDEYQKKEALMTETAKKAEQQKLVEFQRKAEEYRVAKLGNEGELARETEKLLTPLRDRIKNAIAAVAKEEKYSFVFDKTETIQILLYGDPAHDVTFKVIDRLKRGR
jgi:outer membrane protein